MQGTWDESREGRRINLALHCEEGKFQNNGQNGGNHEHGCSTVGVLVKGYGGSSCLMASLFLLKEERSDSEEGIVEPKV